VGILDGFSARKRRERELLASLASIASAEATTDDFLSAGALVKGYGVALGITVPEHTTRILFADGIKYLQEAWRSEKTKVVELASYLSWMQTMAAVNDAAKLAESEDQAEKIGLMLILLTGRLFPASDRAMAIIRDLNDARESTERRRELIEQGAVLVSDNPLMGLHFRAIAQILDKPWNRREVDLVVIHEAQRFLTLLCAEATQYFRRRALQIFEAHVEHGMRPF
jgi:hypothetical protein